MAIPKLVPVSDAAQAAVDSARWDAVVVVSTAFELAELAAVHDVIRAARAVDARVGKDVLLLPAPQLAGGRLIVAPTGPIDRDYDDVRRFAEAARAALVRARDAGARRPLLLLPRLPVGHDYEKALEVALLGAVGGLWEPLEAREALGEAEVEPVLELGFQVPTGADGVAVARTVHALEEGRRLARDLCGTEPERMGPAGFAMMCKMAFHDTDVEVEVLEDAELIRREYPLVAAVARASMVVPRHRPRIIRLEYVPKGAVQETVMLAGKGLVYDTGGADLKTGGHMAGMSRDKGGAAAVAGFMKTLAELRPQGVRVVAELGVVRNSIGSDAYVSDEIIVSHAGVRVRIGNTDAEGRLVLADLLSHLRLKAKGAVAPRLLTVATLTGHAGRAVGTYTVAIENGPARQNRIASGLAMLGELWGDPIEISRIRREDYDFIRPKSRADDVLSCNNAPSTMTDRGHQFPMAFLAVAAGLEQHDRDSKEPLSFTHIDLGGSSCEGGDWQHGRPTAAPVVAMAARWVLGE